MAYTEAFIIVSWKEYLALRTESESVTSIVYVPIYWASWGSNVNMEFVRVANWGNTVKECS